MLLFLISHGPLIRMVRYLISQCKGGKTSKSFWNALNVEHDVVLLPLIINALIINVIKNVKQLDEVRDVVCDLIKKALKSIDEKAQDLIGNLVKNIFSTSEFSISSVPSSSSTPSSSSSFSSSSSSPPSSSSSSSSLPSPLVALDVIDELFSAMIYLADVSFPLVVRIPSVVTIGYITGAVDHGYEVVLG
jgi:hypothetical protein